MRSVLLIPSLIGLSAFNTAAFAADTAWGIHGMVLFDRQARLASHMPLYHAPHNYQVVLALSWEDAVSEVLVTHRQSDELITLVPHRFDLERLHPNHPHPLQEIRVDIYTGHFERDGQLYLQDVAVTIESVLYIAEIDTHWNDPKHDQADIAQHCFQYLNWQDNHYLIEHTRPRPGEDLIIQLDTALGLETGSPLCAEASSIRISDSQFSLIKNQTFDRDSEEKISASQLHGSVLYWEKQDLQ